MEADASLSGASRQCPLSLLPAVTRPFHRSCTEQGNAVSVQRSGSRYLLSGIAGESPWGSQENFFGIRSGRSRRPCPDSLPGVFILTAKVASLFVRTFSHGCFACPHRRTHHVRRRSASVTFRGAGACPSSICRYDPKTIPQFQVQKHMVKFCYPRTIRSVWFSFPSSTANGMQMPVFVSPAYR